MNTTTGLPPTPPLPLPVKIVATLLAAYLAYGWYFGTGLAGWLQVQQQNLMGSYNWMATMIGLGLTLAVAVVLLTLAYALAFPAQAAAQLASQSDSLATTDPAAQQRQTVKIVLAMILATWVIGLGLTAWFEYQDAADRHAHYDAVDLRADAAAAARAASHMALKAQLVGDAVLGFTQHSQKTGDTHYEIVPAVAPTWTPAQPVTLLVQASSAQLLRSYATGAKAMLVAKQGPVPTLAVAEYQKMGIKLAADAVVLRWIPDADGAPQVTEFSDRWLFSAVICAIVSVMLALSTVVARRPPGVRRR